MSRVAEAGMQSKLGHVDINNGRYLGEIEEYQTKRVRKEDGHGDVPQREND